MEADSESSTTSVEDFISNPTRDTLTEGLVCFLKPSLDQLDASVQSTRGAQKELKQQIEDLSKDLHEISQQEGCPVDLEEYVQKLHNAKKRIVIVSNILQGAQV